MIWLRVGLNVRRIQISQNSPSHSAQKHLLLSFTPEVLATKDLLDLIRPAEAAWSLVLLTPPGSLSSINLSKTLSLEHWEDPSYRTSGSALLSAFPSFGMSPEKLVSQSNEWIPVSAFIV
jgi:hypothetical protein